MSVDMLRRLHDVVDQLSGKRVLVLGDYMLDRYIWGDVTRISPEAPVPVVEVGRENVVPGGAGNVVRNLADLGIMPLVCGVIGADEAGDTLASLLGEMNADLTPLVRAEERGTTAKIRIIGNRQQVVRIDYDYAAEPHGDLYAELVERTHDALATADAVIFSDYNKGVLTADVSRAVLSDAGGMGLKVCVDPKPAHIPRFCGAWLISPNEPEAARATGIEIEDDESAIAAARKLRDGASLQAAVITRGGKGMCIYDEDGLAHLIPAVATEVFDVTGAGDTAISVLASCLACDAPLLESAIIANTAGGGGRASHRLRDSHRRPAALRTRRNGPGAGTDPDSGSLTPVPETITGRCGSDDRRPAGHRPAASAQTARGSHQRAASSRRGIPSTGRSPASVTACPRASC